MPAKRNIRVATDIGGYYSATFTLYAVWNFIYEMYSKSQFGQKAEL